MLDTMVYPLARVAALMGPARRITGAGIMDLSQGWL
jgi:hypothetical protein